MASPRPDHSLFVPCRQAGGYISRDEMTENVTELFTSDDPTAPGNWLVGPYE